MIRCVVIVSILSAVCFPVYAHEFPRGEKCVYELSWIKIPVGHFTAEITGEKEFRGRKVYVITFSGGTNRYASCLYRVKDHFISYVDQETLLPLRLEESRKEGFYRKNAVTVFDHEKGKAYFHNYHDGSYKTYSFPQGSHDIVSVFYYLRTISIEAGLQYYLSVLFAEDEFKVTATPRVAPDQEVFPGKVVPAFQVVPQATVKGKPVKDGTVTAYFSRDTWHIPLHFTIKAPLFTRITATLVASPYYHSVDTKEIT